MEPLVLHTHYILHTSDPKAGMPQVGSDERQVVQPRKGHTQVSEV